MSPIQTPIIDSHIHLYPATHLSTLNWTADLPDDHILKGQCSVNEYRYATKTQPQLQGFIFVETDRKFSNEEAGWKYPLEEIAFLVRIAKGRPMPGEGHTIKDSKFMLGMVPWAPLPAGPAALEQYIKRVQTLCEDEETFSLVKGFRYLLQDKPRGTMSEQKFIDGLKWLGEQGFAFDLGVDSRSGGLWQLQDACDMLEQVYRDGSKLRIVINHFCKPNLRLAPQEVMSSDAEFEAWSTCIRRFASFPHTYMKLSGFFSELPPQTEDEPFPVSEMVDRVRPWIEAVLSAFGPQRIMFGSDWPVCQAGGPGTDSWHYWNDFVTALLESFELSPEDQLQIWTGTARKAYSINLPIQ